MIKKLPFRIDEGHKFLILIHLLLTLTPGFHSSLEPYASIIIDIQVFLDISLSKIDYTIKRILLFIA